MKRKEYTFEIKNGATFGIIRTELQKRFPRRPVKAFNRYDKTYNLKVNLDDDEYNDFIETLKNEQIKIDIDENGVVFADIVTMDIDFSVIIANDDNDTKTREYTAYCRHKHIVIKSKNGDFEKLIHTGEILLTRENYYKTINFWAFAFWTGKNGAHLLISTSLGYKNENRVIEKPETGAGFTMRNECRKYNEYILSLIESWAKNLKANDVTINSMGAITLMCNDGAICENYFPDLQELIIFAS